jgi:hypothetical protein
VIQSFQATRKRTSSFWPEQLRITVTSIASPSFLRLMTLGILYQNVKEKKDRMSNLRKRAYQGNGTKPNRTVSTELSKTSVERRVVSSGECKL